MSRLSLSDQLKAASAEIASLNGEVGRMREQLLDSQRQVTTLELGCKQRLQDATAELEKKLKDKESSYSYCQQARDKADSELEQAHAVLDGVTGAPTREYESGGSYSAKHHRNVVTRLAGAFLAIAQQWGRAA